MSPKIKYNSQNSILSLKFSKNKSVDSDVNGNVVLDYDKDGNIVNIDIMKINLEDFVPLRKMKELSISKDKLMARVWYG